DDWDVNLCWLSFPHMTQDQICELAGAGWEIGSHSLYHRDLTRMGAEQRLEELEGSKRLLEAMTGTTIDAISYPFGNTNAAVVDCCKRAGYRSGVVMGRFNIALEVNYVLPRLGVYLYDSPLLFEKKVFGKHEKLFNFIQRGIDFCSDGTVLVKQGFRKPRKSA
ncbi:MAG TPA: polysaccharide deacetylase family protein, partial [bacterium]|nr:polysaccharide deacetylase family protein [bacterium]